MLMNPFDREREGRKGTGRSHVSYSGSSWGTGAPGSRAFASPGDEYVTPVRAGALRARSLLPFVAAYLDPGAGRRFQSMNPLLLLTARPSSQTLETRVLQTRNQDEIEFVYRAIKFSCANYFAR
jgi:hypothetical protein